MPHDRDCLVSLQQFKPIKGGNMGASTNDVTRGTLTPSPPPPIGSPAALVTAVYCKSPSEEVPAEHVSLRLINEWIAHLLAMGIKAQIGADVDHIEIPRPYLLYDDQGRVTKIATESHDGFEHLDDTALQSLRLNNKNDRNYVLGLAFANTIAIILEDPDRPGNVEIKRKKEKTDNHHFLCLDFGMAGVGLLHEASALTEKEAECRIPPRNELDTGWATVLRLPLSTATSFENEYDGLKFTDSFSYLPHHLFDQQDKPGLLLKKIMTANLMRDYLEAYVVYLDKAIQFLTQDKAIIIQYLRDNTRAAEKALILDKNKLNKLTGQVLDYYVRRAQTLQIQLKLAATQNTAAIISEALVCAVGCKEMVWMLALHMSSTIAKTFGKRETSRQADIFQKRAAPSLADVSSKSAKILVL